MAFNPFDPIRKYQKSFLAAACILCMVVFIFSFGPGDLFQTVLGKMAGSGSGASIVSIGGSEITEGDLDKWRRHRERASEFMIRAGSIQYSKQEMDDRKRAQEKTPPQESPEQIQRRSSLQAFAQWIQGGGFGTGPSYFGGDPTRTEDLIDWLIWKYEADKLGIDVSPSDLARIFNRETATEDWWKPGDPITLIPGMEDFMSARFAVRDMGPDELLDTLCQEYRVVLAKEALLGEPPGARIVRDGDLFNRFSNFGRYFANPMVPTPAEFQDFYKKQRTTINALFLPIEVGSLLNSGSGQKPDEAILKALFEMGKDREQNASSDRPGFKSPRRVQVAYVTGSSETVWHKSALARIQITRILAPIVPGFGGPAAALTNLASWADSNDFVTGNMGVLGWVDPYLAFNRKDSLVGTHDQKLKNSRLRGGLLESWLTAPIDQVHGIHAIKAAPVAAFILGNAANSLGVHSLIGADILWKSASFGSEAKDRVNLIAQSRLIGLSALQPLGGFIPSVGAIAALLPSLPKSRDEANIANEVIGDVVTLAAQEDFESTWKRLQNDIGAFKGKNDKAGAETLISTEVKRLGLTYKAMNSARDLFDISKDPALSAFRSAYETKNLNSQNAPLFGDKFFQTEGIYDAQGWANNIDETSPITRDNWTSSKEPYLFWRIDDQRSVKRSLDQARGDVEKFWLTEKVAVPAARDLAQKIAGLANDPKGPAGKPWSANYRDILPEVVTFLSTQKINGKNGLPFEVENVSRLIPQRTTNPFEPVGYESFRFKAADIPFPREGFLDQLLTMDKPGQAIVLRDKPGTTFYVAVLLSKNEPPQADFQRAYERAGAMVDRDELWNRSNQETRRKYMMGTFKDLRSGATKGKVDVDGMIQLPSSVKKKSENPDS